MLALDVLLFISMIMYEYAWIFRVTNMALLKMCTSG